MPNSSSTQHTPSGGILDKLASYFDGQHESILLAWRRAVDNDPRLTTVSHLNREEFEDNIVSSLNLLSRQLREGRDFNQEGSADGIPNAHWAEREESKFAHEHGFHRWQEGYDIRELMFEWGHLHLMLIQVINDFEAEHQSDGLMEINWARLVVAQLLNAGFSQSVIEYHRLQQAEAKEIVNSLSGALKQVTDWEHHRGQVLREAVHDLRGNLSAVQAATSILGNVLRPEADPAQQNKVLDMLQRSTSTLSDMLSELLDLARLEAGQEKRDLEPVEVGVLVSGLCDTARPLAQAKNLTLEYGGTPNLTVEGDPLKIQRITQNLLLNAIKYTEQGGVTVSWEEGEPNLWRLSVQDTGPGIKFLQGKPSIIQVLTEGQSSESPESPSAQFASGSNEALADELTPERAGEGVGIVIVKRLCALLDAQLEVETAAGVGTTFRVTFPRTYAGVR